MAKKCMQCGGSTKKMAKGGMPSRTPILGPPKKPFAAGIPFFTGAGQTGPSSMKTGGMVSRSVQSSCKNGMVRGEDGRCVKARPLQFASGGSVKNAKFAALAPPYNKATFADKIVGAKRNTKKK
jgi:hypothetical protein